MQRLAVTFHPARIFLQTDATLCDPRPTSRKGRKSRKSGDPLCPPLADRGCLPTVFPFIKQAVCPPIGLP